MNSFTRGRGRGCGRLLEGQNPPPRRPYDRPTEAADLSRPLHGNNQVPPTRDPRPNYPMGSTRQTPSSTPQAPVSSGSSPSLSGANVGTRQPGMQNPLHLLNKGKEGVPHHHCVANFFELLKRPNWRLLQYRVEFNPEICEENDKKMALRQHGKMIGRYVYYRHLLYTIQPLAQPMELVVQSEGQSSVRLILTCLGEVRHNDPINTVVLNIILRRCLAFLDLNKIQGSYYDPCKEKFLENYKLKIWTGYTPSIRIHEDGLLLGVASVQKIVRSDTAHEFVRQIHADWMTGGQQQNLKQMVAEKMFGRTVITNYNQRAYRVDGIDYDMTPTSTFYCRKVQRQVSYLEYYARRYGVEITDLRQPLLFSRRYNRISSNDDLVFLVPQLCIMTGLTETMRDDIHLMKDIAEITQEIPTTQLKSFVEFSKRMFEHSEVRIQLNDWGLQFSREPVKCEARTLPSPNIIQATSTYRVPPNGDWSKDLTENGRQMAAAPPLNTWFIVYPQNMSADVSAFLIEFKHTAARQLGFTIAEPTKCAIGSDQSRNYVDCVRNEKSRQDYQLAVVVLRRYQTDTYRKIKALTCCELPIPSQFVTGQLFRGGAAKRKSMAVKLVIQVAAKIGAEPWRVDVPSQNVMVCGYDPFRDKHQRKTVGAFVASINGTCSRYTSSVELHGTNEQISPNLHVHVVKALKAYMEENQGQLPERIFLYRDASNVVDMMRTKNAEIEAIKSACRNVGTNRIYMPGIAYILISRKISARFFAMTGAGAENPPIGLIVDGTVTLPQRFDYFLVSKIMNQSTASPTLYHVIHDTSQTTPDHHQRLAYALTHLYYNWAGTLNIPAPVQYARKLARLVGECGFTARPHERLAKLPYYL